MAAHFTVHLVAHDTKHEFKTADYLKVFPGSMIALALTDASTETIDITEKSITPGVMTYLQSLVATGVIGPYDGLDLQSAYRYMGIEIFGLLSDPTFEYKSLTPGINLLDLDDVELHYTQLIYHGIDQLRMYGQSLIRYILAVTRPEDHEFHDQTFLEDHMVKIPSLLRMFLKRQVNLTVRNNQLLIHAVEQGPPESLKILLEDGRVDPGLYENRALMRILHNKNGKSREAILRTLLADRRVNPADRDHALFHDLGRQVMYEDWESTMIILLEDKRMDPSSRGHRILTIALPDDILKLILEDDRVNPSANDNQALLYHDHDREYEQIKYLLNHPKFDPNNFVVDDLIHLQPVILKFIHNHPKLNSELKELIHLRLNPPDVALDYL